MFNPIFSKLSSIEMGSTSFLAAVTAQTPILHAWVRWLVQKAASNGAPALLGSPGRLAVDAPSPKLGKVKENWYLESMQQWFDFQHYLLFDVAKNSAKMVKIASFTW